MEEIRSQVDVLQANKTCDEDGKEAGVVQGSDSQENVVQSSQSQGLFLPEEENLDNQVRAVESPVELLASLEEMVPETGIIRRTKSGKELAVKVAKAYRDARAPRIQNKPGKPKYDGMAGKKFPLLCPDFALDEPNLSDISVGISLYFYTLRKLAILFFVLFIIGIPSIVVGLIANPDSYNNFKHNGVSALQVFTVAAMFKATADQKYGCSETICTFPTGEVRTETIASIIIYFDLVSCLALLLAIPFFRRTFRRIEETIDDENITAKDFSVMVWGIPKDCTSGKVRDHFEYMPGSGAIQVKTEGEEPVTAGVSTSDDVEVIAMNTPRHADGPVEISNPNHLVRGNMIFPLDDVEPRAVSGDLVETDDAAKAENNAPAEAVAVNESDGDPSRSSDFIDASADLVMAGNFGNPGTSPP